jgi:hypothetical protein
MRRTYSVRKGEGPQNYNDRPPYPGVIIEEMLDSASMQNGDNGNNYPVALIGEQDQQHRDPDVSL